MLMPSLFRTNVFDDLFDDFAKETKRAAQNIVSVTGVMKTDIVEKDDCFELMIDLPGFTKEDVKAELKEGYLNIQAERNTSSEEKDEEGRFIRRERYSGTCSRSFYVGDDLKQDDIKAKFENGILKLTVPKKPEEPEEDEPQYISID
ncbi:MAG: Hsp20/alpha crystallin family protein [Firmicutes bacterium]|jgi:HSP20 family molecular chaperone IbpA|nr:Hsp20/alpha crystallin family protein [Bacillota bacterium]